MEDSVLKFFLLAATALTGILCGASLDQSIKQLPARRRIGAIAFSTYAKAADLKNGVPWYAVLGLSAAITSIITAILVLKNHSAENYALSLYCAGVLAICHSTCTAFAAPAYHKQKNSTNENELEKLFSKFEKIQTLRSVFVTLNFISLLWAISTFI
jgi:hypothetical protein